MVTRSNSLPREDQSADLGSVTRTIARGGGIALFGLASGQVLLFFLHIFLGRFLGPEGYGLYALGLSIISILQAVSLLGLDQGVIRYCSIYQGTRDSAGAKGTVIQALVFSLVAGLLIGLIIFFLAPAISTAVFRDPRLTGVLRVFALALPFLIITAILTALFQAFKRIDYQQIVQNLVKPGSHFLLFGIAVVSGFRLRGALGSFLVSAIICAGLSIRLLIRIFPEIKSNLAPRYNPKQLFAFSIPTLFIGISYLV